MPMNPFKRSVLSETKRKSGKGVGGKSAFYEKYRLPKGTPTPIMLIKGEYSDPNPAEDQIEIDPQTGHAKPVINAFGKARVHKRKLILNGREEYREEYCSAGLNSHNPQPCAGCYAMDSGDKSVTASDVFAFGIVHLHPYHTHPLVDRKTGQLVQKKDGTGYVLVDTECEGRACNFCRVASNQPILPKPGQVWPNFSPQDISTKFGKRRYIQVGKGHLENLGSWDSTIRGQCGNCNTELVIVGYSCPNCRSVVIDLGPNSTDPRTDEQIELAVSRPYPCPKCERPAYLNEMVECDGCHNPSQLSVFDVVCFGLREGEGPKSAMVLRRHEALKNFKAPPNLLNGKTVEEIVAELAKPYDFEEILKPGDLETQAQRLGLTLPTQLSGPPQTPKFQNYKPPTINYK